MQSVLGFFRVLVLIFNMKNILAAVMHHQAIEIYE